MKKIVELDNCRCIVLPDTLGKAAADRIAQALKVLADPARLRIINCLATMGEACVCELTDPLGKGQPTVSHHLKILADAGILQREKRGVWVYYKLVPRCLDEVVRVLGGAA